MSPLIPPIIQVAGLIAGAILTALLAVRGYREQKTIDRKVELLKLRRKNYEQYLQSYYEYTRWSGEDEVKEAEAAWKYNQAYFSLFQTASDKVLEAAMEFHNFVWKGNNPLTGKAYRERFEELYAKVVFEMRKDAFEETRLPKELIEDNLPWSWGNDST